MKELRLLCTLISLLCASLCTAWAQAVDTTSGSPLSGRARIDTSVAPQADRFGIFGSFDLFLHRSDFNTLPGVPSCCSHYPSGSGDGFSAGILYEHALEEGWLVGARLGYEHVQGTFNDREPTTFIVKGVPTDGAIGYTLDAGYGIVVLEPLVGYRLLDNIAGKLSLTANMGIGFGLKTGSSYTQHEDIVEPADIGAYTENGTPTRNAYSGAIPQAIPFMMDIRVGVALEAMMNRARTLAIAPELWYSIGMSPVAHTINWSVDGLRVGLALSYSPPRAAEADTTGR